MASSTGNGAGGDTDAEADTAPPDRVLVVDDNEDAVLGLSIILRRWGLDVRTAYDGETALSIAEEFRPAKVLLDIGLPRMDGWEVAKRLRASAHGERALLIAVTGYGSPADKQRSRDAGIDHHLVKPADPVELRRLLLG